jgi:conjugative transfer signal peptidase TraF
MMLVDRWLRLLRSTISALGQHRRLCLRASLQVVAMLAGIATTLTLSVGSGFFKLNLSESMPLGLYLLRPTTSIHAGDLVIACPPRAAQSVGLANGYLARGHVVIRGYECAAGSAPVLKYAIGVAGDELEIDGRGLSLNGRLLSRRPRALMDRHQRRLDSLANGRYRIQKGDVWLYSPERYSWDSRYFGTIKESDVLGIAKPIWTAQDGFKSQSSLH